MYHLSAGHSDVAGVVIVNHTRIHNKRRVAIARLMIAWVLLLFYLIIPLRFDYPVIGQPIDDGNQTAKNSPVEAGGDSGKLSLEEIRALHRSALLKYGEKKYAEALADYSKILLNDSTDVIALYNTACVQALLDHPSKAAKLLVNAVQAGFIDFQRMINDPDLDSVRDEPEYQAILEMQDELRDSAGTRLENLARKLLGKSAIVERDDELRIIFGANLDRETFDRMKRKLERQMTWQIDHLFDGPPNSFVLVLLPTPEKAQAIIGSARIGGFYDHDKKQLVSRDLGSSLQHELTHALHHGQMDRLGQVHPVWLQEGLASVFEMYEIDNDGERLRVPGNARLNIAINLEHIHGLTKWKKLFSLSDKKFVGSRPRARYAEARTIFQFLAEKGLLEEWYRSYVKHYNEDSTGRVAFLEVFHAEKLKTVEDEFKRWLQGKEPVPEEVPSDHAALGLWVVDQAANDGVEIVGLHPGGAARGSGIIPREVITAVDGEPVYSAEELVFRIMQHDSGDAVTLHLRRGKKYHDVTIHLRPVVKPKRVEIVQAPGALV